MAGTEPASVAECDRLAASPDDYQRPEGLTGVKSDQIDVEKATAACEAAVRDAPDNARMKFQLGRALSKNKDRRKDYFTYTSQAAAAGYSAALINMAAAYMEGKGVEADRAKAVDYMRQAASAPHFHPKAMHLLGLRYIRGDDGEKDAKQGTGLICQAAEAGYVPAVVDCGRNHEYGEGRPIDMAKALDYYHRATEAGDGMGAFYEALVYRYGKSVPIDNQKARALFETAASRKWPGAFNNLGILYERGIGVDQDYAEAVAWYEQGAALGDALSMVNLGMLVEAGNGAPADPVRAADLYRQGADAGNPQGLNSLGWLYERGLGVPKDERKATDLYRQAAELGNLDAMNNLALNLISGIGTEVNQKEGMDWMQKAADEGGVLASFNLGLNYMEAHRVERNPTKAAYYFLRSLQFGGADAHAYLIERRGEKLDRETMVELMRQLGMPKDKLHAGPRLGETAIELLEQQYSTKG